MKTRAVTLPLPPTKYVDAPDPTTDVSSVLFNGPRIGVLAPAATSLVIISNQPTSATGSASRPVYFGPVVATNDSVLPPQYQWRRSNGAGGMTNIPGATAQRFGLVASTNDNGAQFDVLVIQPGQPELTRTSIVATLTLLPTQFVPGLIFHEVWNNQPNNATALDLIRSGASGPPNLFTGVTNTYDIGDLTNNYAQRLSGLFIPPETTNYVFFAAGNDDMDVFLNPNGDQPSGKIQIAEQLGSTATRWEWQEAAGTLLEIAQQRSDQYSADGVTVNYPTGIPLAAGNRYYLEVVHRAGGGDSWCGLTYAPYIVDESNINTNVPPNGANSTVWSSVIGHLAPAATARTLTIALAGNNVNVTWSPPGGTLLSSPTLPGVWNPVPGANSAAGTATVPIGPGSLFLRVSDP